MYFCKRKQYRQRQGHYSMKVKNGKACKFGKWHLYGEVAEGEIFKTGRCISC